MSIDLEKSTRETRRWLILQTLGVARPIGAAESLLMSAITQSLPTTQRELRLDLDYLKTRELIELTGVDTLSWHAKLTRIGIDLVEYTVSCEPGIARPQKYW